jgi:hypothetical protein
LADPTWLSWRRFDKKRKDCMSIKITSEFRPCSPSNFPSEWKAVVCDHFKLSFPGKSLPNTTRKTETGWVIVHNSVTRVLNQHGFYYSTVLGVLHT